MTKLREILAYVSAKPSNLAPFSELRSHFHGDLTGLKVALDRGLLELRFSCYAVTVAGVQFLDSVTTVNVDEKVCYQCQRTLPADRFWKNQSSVDGLFSYCITCGTQKKREAMERYQEARAAVAEAAADLVAAAAQWDEACTALGEAWARIMAADTAIRMNAQVLKTDNDSGRMHARTTFPRAAYILNLRLLDARYPQTVPFLREVGFGDSLADYIGEDPHGDYVKLDDPRKVGGSRHGSSEEPRERGEGTEEGRPEQGDEGAKGNGARRPRSSGRRRVPAAPSEKEKPRRVPKARRAVLA